MTKGNERMQVSPKSVEEEVVRYQVVEFIEERRGTKKSFDYVPANWIKFDSKLGKCVAKFMESLDTPDDCRLMDDLRITEADAPESWLWYPVVLRGEANTVAEAIKKAELLNNAEYAYSTDNEEHAKQKSDAVVRIYKAKSKKKVEKRLEDIMSFDENDFGSASDDVHSGDGLSDSNAEVIARRSDKKTSSSQKKLQSQKSNTSTKKRILGGRKSVANHTTKAGSKKNNLSVKCDGREVRKEFQKVLTKKKDYKPCPIKSTQPLKDIASNTENDSNSVSNDTDSEDGLSDLNADLCARGSEKETSPRRKKLEYQKSNSPTKKRVSSAGKPVVERTTTGKSTPGLKTKNAGNGHNKNTSKEIFKVGREVSDERKDDELQPEILALATAAISDNATVHPTTSNCSKKSIEEQLKTFPAETQLLYLAIKGLAADVQKNSEDIKSLRQAIQNVLKIKISTVTIDAVVEKRGIPQLPLKDQTQLQSFIKKLDDDAQFCTEFVDVLQHFVESDVTKTLALILRKLFDRLLAMECTAVKQVPGKFLLKNTKIYTILFELVCARHSGATNDVVSELEYRKALSSVLYNAKDWDGHRNTRKKPDIPPAAPVVVEVPVEIVAQSDNE